MRNAALILVLLVFCGCTGNGTERVEVVDQPDIAEARYSFVPIEELPRPVLDPELAPFFPAELQGLLPLTYPTDPLGNDLALAAPMEKDSILASVEKVAGAVYLAPRNVTDVLVFYRVYKTNGSEYAQRALSAYRSNWNRERWQVSGREVWIWRGYEEQIKTNQFPFPAGEPLYWDPDSNAVYFFQEPKTLPVVALLGSNLYGLHGEAAFDRYFIMIDVQGIPQEIEAKARGIFSSILSQEVYGLSIEPPKEDIAVQPPADETASVKDRIKLLNEEYYVKGNLSEEEYDAALEVLMEQYKTHVKEMAK